MNSKNHDLTEFEELITELENPEVRPHAPNLPRAAKEEMRRALLAKQQQGGLSRQAAKNLWRFAGTAVAAFLLLFVVASFIAVLSNSSIQAGGQQNVVTPPTRTPIEVTSEVANGQAETQHLEEPVAMMDLMGKDIVFNYRVQLDSYGLIPVEDGTVLTLRWLPHDTLDERFYLFVHLIDENGNLVLQVDGLPAAEMPIISSEEQTVVEGNILLPTNDLGDGRFDIIIGLYNTETGERLSLFAGDPTMSRDNDTAVRIGSWSRADMLLADAPVMTVGAGDSVETGVDIQFGDDLHLSTFQFAHEGNEITLSLDLLPLRDPLPDYVLALQITDENGVLVDRLHQPILNGDLPTSAWAANVPVSADFALRLPELLPNGRYQSSVAIFNKNTGQFLPITQGGARQGTELGLEQWQQDGSVNAADMLPLTVAADNIFGLTLHQLPDGDPYDLTLDENVTFSLANSDGDHLVEADNTTWISFGVTNAATGEDYRAWVPLSIYNRIKAFGLAFKTQPEWQESGEVWLVSVTQKERPSATAPIELEITLSYEFVSDEDVFIKLSYADPDWENVASGGRLPVDSLENPVFLDNNRGEVTINATLSPNEAMQIVETENPVLLAELGYIEEFADDRDNVIRFLAHETFGDYPLDLTATEAVEYLPK